MAAFHLKTTVICTKRKRQDCLRHGLLVGFFKRICPVNDYVTAPDASPATPNPMLCHRGWLVAVVFQKCKAAILLLRIVWRTVDYNVKQAIWKHNNKISMFLQKISTGYVSTEIFTFKSCLAVTCQVYDICVEGIKYKRNTQQPQTCVLFKLVQYIFFALVLRNISNEKTHIGNRYVDFKVLSRPDFKTIQLKITNQMMSW